MRTRCPQCATIFRITPEQLRLRAGKVRCGHCQAIFNALDTLIEEAHPLPAMPAHPVAEIASPPAPEPAPPPAPPEAEPEPAPEAAAAEPASINEEPETFPTPENDEEDQAEAVSAPSPEPESEEPEPESAADASPTQPIDETPEETTQAAREAGLVAARELTETPGYNRWAAGTLAASPLGGLEAEGRHRVTWPFTVVTVLLIVALTVQLAFHFRTELAQRMPSAAALFAALGIDVPLPHDANLVSIEASDLQADNARGLLVLQATLKNRAPYAQSWPALELTLTDAHDAAVARRVLHPADYLPASADPGSFAANGETAIRLWIEAKGVPAVGYRLYVFYP